MTRPGVIRARRPKGQPAAAADGFNDSTAPAGGFEDDDRNTRPLQMPSGGEPCDAGAKHGDRKDGGGLGTAD